MPQHCIRISSSVLFLFFPPYPQWSVVSEYPASNQLPLVVKTLPKDVLPASLTRHIDVFLQKKNKEKANILIHDLNVSYVTGHFVKVGCSTWLTYTCLLEQKPPLGDGLHARSYRAELSHAQYNGYSRK